MQYIPIITGVLIAVLILFIVLNKRAFRYLEPLWLGADGKISLKSSLAMMFSVDFVSNLSHSIYKWDASKSMEGLSLVLGIEAGLIVSLLGITAWSNVAAQKIDKTVGMGGNGDGINVTTNVTKEGE